MDISSFLQIKPGLTAIIGGGGKTTLMYELAEELKSLGTVIVCTSTRIFRPSYIPVLTCADEARLLDALRQFPVVCVGTDSEEGKIRAPVYSFVELQGFARYVLVEADGSKGLPMKAHEPHEPVIPDNTGQTILTVGASGFGLPISEAAHRPALYAKLAGVGFETVISPEIAARVALAEGFHDTVFVNQVESETMLEAVRELKALLGCPVCSGSLFKKEYQAIE